MAYVAWVTVSETGRGEMKLHSRWPVLPVLAALAVALGGLVAPNLAQADACTDAWPVRPIVTIGKGQSPSNNPKVLSVITGNIVAPDSLGPTAHRIRICEGTAVSVRVEDTTGDPTVTGACTSASCTIPALDSVEKYKAVSFDGKDTDRMTLRPV